MEIFRDLQSMSYSRTVNSISFLVEVKEISNRLIYVTDIYQIHFRQIDFAFKTNSFHIVDKYILHFRQIQFSFETNTLCILENTYNNEGAASAVDTLSSLHFRL